MKKFSGFTLAEVLITLGIIGVVAAMTIPILITEHQKRTTVTKLQKAISVINQAYRLAYDDVGEATAEEAKTLVGKGYYDKYWAPYIKTMLYCTSISQCGYKEKQPYHHLNGNQAEVYIVAPSTRATFYTMDGFLYCILVQGGAGGILPQSLIFVDINGASKPNIIGKDLFYLNRKIDGEKGGVVVPNCENNTDAYINNECKKGAGWCCAEKIRRASWKIDKSYPWKG